MALTTITGNMVSVNAIQGTLIADNAITAVHIATNAVSGTLIADNAVTAVHIAQNSITVTQLADDCVESDKIADGVITTNHLNSAMISSQTEVTAVAGDFVLLGDTSDSNNLKKTPVSSITALATISGISSSADATAITIDSSENVGIGTSSPASNLHIKTSVDNSLSQGLVIERSANTDRGYINYNGGAFQFRSTVGDPIVFGETDSEHLRVAPDGNVGIGTTSPTSKLHVYGGATGSGLDVATFKSATGALNIKCSDLSATNPTWTLRTFSGEPLAFGQGTSEVARFDSSGNFGIGTTNPQKLLHVADLSGSAQIMISSSDSGVASLQFSDAVGGSVARGYIEYDNSTNHLALGTGALERLRVDSSGNVLVGTTTTDRTADDGITANGVGFMDVSRSSNISGRFTRRSSDGSIVDFRKDGTAVGSIGVSGGNNPYFSSAVANHGGLIFSDGGSSTPQMNPISSGSTLVDNAMNIGSAGYRFKDLYLSGIASIGNLKIGTDQGTDGQVLTSTGSGVAWEAAAGGETNRLPLAGGTMSGNILMTSNVLYASELYSASRIGHLDDASTYIDFDVDTIKFATSGEAMRITSTGNVGIGTTAPGTLLEVSHSAGAHTPVLRLTGTSTSAYSGGLEFYTGYGGGKSIHLTHATASGSQGGEYWQELRNQSSNTLKRTYHVSNAARHTFHGQHNGDSTGHFLFTNSLYDATNTNCTLAVQNGGTFIQIMGWTTLGARIGTRTAGWNSNSGGDVYFTRQDATSIKLASSGPQLGNGTAISSDRRLKENITNLADGQLTKINALTPRTFTWKDTRKPGTHEGFIAQEVEAVIPEAVFEDNFAPDPDDTSRDFDGDIKLIKHEVINARLVKAVQELSAKLEAAEARITTLENE